MDFEIQFLEWNNTETVIEIKFLNVARSKYTIKKKFTNLDGLG